MVALTKPSPGDTNWATPVNDNWTAIEKQVIAFQGRLQWDSTAGVSLQRYGGDTVDVNGTGVSLGASGIQLLTTDNLITSAGGDAGSAMLASTLYYVYLSNSSASTFPVDLRASATAPSFFNGVKYLGTSGNAANWRFVGWVRTDGSTQFVDSDTQRFVVNYFNRQRKRLFTCPGYSNNNTKTSYTRAGNWAAANGGSGSKIEFIANGEDSVRSQIQAAMICLNNVEPYAGIGIDTTTSPVRCCWMVGNSTTGSVGATNVCAHTEVLSEGYHSADLLVACNTGTATYFADGDRNGASADPYLTYIEAEIMA